MAGVRHNAQDRGRSVGLLFPVASAFLDGLGRTSPACLDLAHTMGANRWQEMSYIRIPMALPMLGSGQKLAAVYAPVGVVIGEWVGGSQGLGAVMIHANGRMRIELTFAALALVTVLTLAFHALVCALTDRMQKRKVAPVHALGQGLFPYGPHLWNGQKRHD